MKIKITSLPALVVLVLGLSGPAQAAVFDFATLGNNPVFPNGPDFGAFTGPMTVDSITLNVSASHTSNLVVPYLDAAFDGRDAGLGICSAGIDAANQCKKSSDDNVSTGEKIHLYFDTPVEITDLAFRDQKHFTTFDSWNKIYISVDGASLGALAINDMVLNGIATPGEHFDFSFKNQSFYIENLTAVPLPAALPLMFSALAGLGLIGWRRGKNAAAVAA